jgi:glycosyltransferase involved in cell wall biosynthesis
MIGQVKPKYTIFVPVHNGGEYVKQCIASIFGQRFGDFGVVVLENASTDGTREWLESLSDPRLTISPSEQLLPIERNWGRALLHPKNEYMTFFGHDDLLDPDYLGVMDGLVHKAPTAGLYFAHFRYIDREGGVIRSCRRLPPKETAAEYAAALFSRKRDTYGSGYMYRSSRYEQVGGMPDWDHLLFADDTLWMTLMMGSWKATAPEECFAVRVHPGSYGHRAGCAAWAEAMDRYTTFLQCTGIRDSEFAAALSKHAPSYFLEFCNVLYSRDLLDACGRNRRFDPEIATSLCRVLRKIAPQKLDEFKGGRRSRFARRVLLNRFGATRWLYYRYRLARYGANR